MTVGDLDVPGDSRLDRCSLCGGPASGHGHGGVHSDDRRHRRGLRFVVRPGPPHETDRWPVSLDGRWSIG